MKIIKKIPGLILIIMNAMRTEPKKRETPRDSTPHLRKIMKEKMFVSRFHS